MNWEWPYVIAIVGTLVPGILGVLGWMNERRKNNADITDINQKTAINMISLLTSRNKDLEDDLDKCETENDELRKKIKESELRSNKQ